MAYVVWWSDGPMAYKLMGVVCWSNGNVLHGISTVAYNLLAGLWKPCKEPTMAVALRFAWGDTVKLTLSLTETEGPNSACCVGPPRRQKV